MSEARISSIGQTNAVGLFSITFEGDDLTEFRKFIGNSRMMQCAAMS